MLTWYGEGGGFRMGHTVPQQKAEAARTGTEHGQDKGFNTTRFGAGKDNSALRKNRQRSKRRKEELGLECMAFRHACRTSHKHVQGEARATVA